VVAGGSSQELRGELVVLHLFHRDQTSILTVGSGGDDAFVADEHTAVGGAGGFILDVLLPLEDLPLRSPGRSCGAATASTSTRARTALRCAIRPPPLDVAQQFAFRDAFDLGRLLQTVMPENLYGRHRTACGEIVAKHALLGELETAGSL